MDRFIYAVFGIFILGILNGCEEGENVDTLSNIEFVKYGTSFGECLGYCVTDIKVTDSKIDFHKSGWDLEGILPAILKSENIDKQYWTELIGKIDFNAFLQLDSIIGCPDCADGGAEWIELKNNEKSYKVVFEYRNEPDILKGYIGYLRTYLNTFQINSDESVDFNNRTIIDQKGIIKNFVSTRGSYQYLIGITNGNDTIYYCDKYLNAEYHQDKLMIEFNGVLQYDSTLIYKPAPNDIPILDFKTRNINTFDVEIISDKKRPTS